MCSLFYTIPQCKLSHRNRYGVPSSLSLLHNELQTESDLENVDLPSLDATCGPQAANPKRKKSTVCNGGTLASNYPYQCEKTTSGGKEFKVYDADALTWSCRKEHTGLCYYCYKANTCPVCGTTRKRLQSHA